MILLNVSFGIYAMMPQGWLFMLFIVFLECVILSYLLRGSWKNKRVYMTVTLSNFISGVVGFIISLKLNGGWWLVIWLPWVSENEVDLTTGLGSLTIYYLSAFILTLILEALVNTLLLKREYGASDIIKATSLTNVASYIAGSVMLYSYSF